jgi:hypothetical protein
MLLPRKDLHHPGTDLCHLAVSITRGCRVGLLQTVALFFLAPPLVADNDGDCRRH